MLDVKIQVLTSGSGRAYEQLLKKEAAYFARIVGSDFNRPLVIVHHNLNPKFKKVSWLTDAKDRRYETVLIPTQAFKEFVVHPRAVGRGKSAN